MTSAPADEQKTVLIVEDEAPIRAGLVALFESQGFSVRAVGDGNDAITTLGAHAFDAVLLDIMLPGTDGLSVLRHLRARDDTVPVLLLTAKGAEEDVVAGLEAGADDYVTKPFGVHALVARVRGLLRRARTTSSAQPATSARKTAIGDCLCDLDALKVSRGDVAVALTAREGDLLAFLMERQGAPATREALLVGVWGYRDGTIQTRTVDVHIQQLRAKLKALGGDVWIETQRGRGYRFVGAGAA